MSIIDFVIVVVILAFFAAIYYAYHKEAETKLFAKLDMLNTGAEASSPTLTSIETKLAAHGVTLASIQAVLDKLEDKATNAITDVEKNKAVADVEAAVNKAEEAFKAAVAIRDALTPAAAAPAAAITAATTVPAGTQPFGLEGPAFSADPTASPVALAPAA